MGAVYFQWSFSSILACFTVRDRGNQIGRYINLVDKKTNLKTTWLSFLSTLEEKKQIIFTGDEYKRNGYKRQRNCCIFSLTMMTCLRMDQMHGTTTTATTDDWKTKQNFVNMFSTDISTTSWHTSLNFLLRI